MKVIIISAMAENRVIGSHGKLPWNIPEEYQLFLDHVRHNTVIIGRRSFEEFGEDLIHAHTYVLSKSVNKFENTIVYRSLDSALSKAYKLGNDIYIAGGADVYSQSMGLADLLYLSTVKGNYEGDAYFPIIDTNKWELIEERYYPRFIFRIWKAVKTPEKS